MAAALLHKSFVKSLCTSGEATSKQVGVYPLLQKENVNDELREEEPLSVVSESAACSGLLHGTAA